VIDPAPRQIPAPDAVKRALDLLKGAKKPLIMLGKGAAYAQADADIRALVEKSGIPFLPMSMAKGLLPDTHPQCAAAARSYVLKEADVVMLIGARLNWLLSHGKGKTGATRARRSSSRSTSSHREMDSNVEIDAPLVGDIGSCVAALLAGMGNTGQGRRPTGPARRQAQGRERRQDGAAADEQPSPMDFHGALGVLRTTSSRTAGRHPGQRRRQHARLARGIIDMYQPRKRLDVGTWGDHGHRHGLRIAAAVETGKPVLAIEGDSAFGFSGMEVETICRYNLPVCIVIFNNNGIYRGTDVNRRRRRRRADRVHEGARYDKMMEAFGGVGVHATTADELQARRQRGHGFRQADADQRRDRSRAAGTESGRIGNLNPAKAAIKK
jgi:oxalyl-CoA decarboxylase